MFPFFHCKQLLFPTPVTGGYLTVFWSHFIVFFIFFCRNSKIATHCWTIIDRRMLDLTKKRYPMSKGKEETLGSPLDCRDIKPVNPKGNQSWMFIGRTDAEAETSVLWPPDANNWLIWKDPNAGKDWRREEKGMAVDEMVGWHHRQRTWVWVYARSW